MDASSHTLPHIHISPPTHPPTHTHIPAVCNVLQLVQSRNLHYQITRPMGTSTCDPVHPAIWILILRPLPHLPDKLYIHYLFLVCISCSVSSGTCIYGSRCLLSQYNSHLFYAVHLFLYSSKLTITVLFDLILGSTLYIVLMTYKLTLGTGHV